MAEGDLAHGDEAYHAAFAVNKQWTMRRHNKYEDSLCYLMAFAHNCPFSHYKKGKIFTREQLLELKPHHIHNWL